MIGNTYKYHGSKNTFVLKEIRPFSYKFECGHWCTDNVFKDLVCVKGIQLGLFTNLESILL